MLMQKSNENSLSFDLRKYFTDINSPIVKYTKLSDTIKNNLYHDLEKINLDPYLQFNEILQDIKKLNIAEKNFSSFFSKNNKVPLFFLENLPVDIDLIATPPDDGYCINKTRITEKAILLLSSAIKFSPYINKDEKGNKVIQNIVPIKGKEFELSGASSSITFNWHTENIHEATPPEYFILYALRGDKNAYTSIMLVDDIVKNLPQEMVKELLRVPFVMKTGPSYTKEITFIRPILSQGIDGSYEIHYNSDINRCRPTNIFGEDLYNVLQQIINKKTPSYRVSLKPGEAMIINNKKALHKRDAFQISTNDEERRWLQVVYLKNFTN